MKYLFLTCTLFSLSFASIDTINSFEADFTQTLKDDKKKVLTYTGHIVAKKPQNALWNYFKPIKKDIYINTYSITIVEPEIEQVIIKTIESNFDFFKMIQHAKKIGENLYEANYKDSKFKIQTQGNTIESISYIDEFENDVKITFTHQKQNEAINDEVFIPVYPLEFDIIRD